MSPDLQKQCLSVQMSGIHVSAVKCRVAPSPGTCLLAKACRQGRSDMLKEVNKRGCRSPRLPQALTEFPDTYAPKWRLVPPRDEHVVGWSRSEQIKDSKRLVVSENSLKQWAEPLKTTTVPLSGRSRRLSDPSALVRYYMYADNGGLATIHNGQAME